MVRFAHSPCDRQQAHVVVGFLDELASGLPHPSRKWKWGDAKLSHECLMNLKVSGLIQPETETGISREWRTTEAAWEDVRSRVDDQQTRVEAFTAVA
jgi:hypothetical protein